jgi:hypothetical protein
MDTIIQTPQSGTDNSPVSTSPIHAILGRYNAFVAVYQGKALPKTP